MDQTFRPLMDALKRRGVDPQMVDYAAEEAERSGRSMRAVLINDQIVTEQELTAAAADAYGVQTVDLVGYPIEQAALQKIPLSLVQRHRVIGITIEATSSRSASPTRPTWSRWTTCAPPPAW